MIGPSKRIRLLFYFSTWARQTAKTKEEAERWIRFFADGNLSSQLCKRFLMWMLKVE